MELLQRPRPRYVQDVPRPSDEGRGASHARVRRWSRRIASGLLWLAVLGLLALAVGPSFLPFRSHAVLGRSMEPTIPYRSLAVFVPADAEELRVGDIVAFHPPKQPDRLVTHRIVGEELTPAGRSLVTQGDANGAPDGWRISARGEGWRYAFHVPLLGYLQFALAGPLGRTALLATAVLAFGAWALLRIWRPRPGRRSATQPHRA